MKIEFKHIAIVTALALPLAACSQETTNAAGNTAHEMAGKMNDAAKQIAAQFHELKAKAETQMSGVDTTIADLKAKAADKSGDAKTEIDQLVEQLKAKKDQIAKAIAETDMKNLDDKAIAGLKSTVHALNTEAQKLIEKAKAI